MAFCPPGIRYTSQSRTFYPLESVAPIWQHTCFCSQVADSRSKSWPASANLRQEPRLSTPPHHPGGLAPLCPLARTPGLVVDTAGAAQSAQTPAIPDTRGIKFVFQKERELCAPCPGVGRCKPAQRSWGRQGGNCRGCFVSLRITALHPTASYPSSRRPSAGWRVAGVVFSSLSPGKPVFYTLHANGP